MPQSATPDGPGWQHGVVPEAWGSSQWDTTLPAGTTTGEIEHSPVWLRRDIIRVAALAVGINGALAVQSAHRGLLWPPDGFLAVVAALLFASSLWVVVGAVLGSPDLRPERAFVVAATAANFVALLAGPKLPAPAGTAFLNASTIIGACLAAVSFGTLRTGVCWVAALGVGYAALRAPDVGWPIGALEACVAMLGSLSVGLFARALGSTYVQLAEVERARSRARDAAMRREQAERIRLEWDRLVHDKVLGALILASRSSSFDTLATARELAGDALRALGVLDGPTHGSRSLHEMGTRLGVQVTGPVALPPGLPDDVQRAFTAALEEVLGNVRRHSGVGAATIEVTGDRNALVVRVHDGGVGFDPISATGRFGVEHSIPGHMATVGGTSMLESAPGAGTTVTLSWQAVGPTAMDSDPGSSIDWHVGGISVLATLPLVWVLLHIALGWSATHGQWDHTYAGWPLGVWGGTVALLAAVLLARLPGSLASSASLALSTGAVALLAVMTPSEAATAWRLWFVGASLPLAVVFVLTGRERFAWAYAALTPVALAVGLSAHGLAPVMAEPGSFVSPPLVTLAAVMSTRGLRRAHLEMRRAFEDLSLLTRAERASALAAQASGQRRDELSRDIIPLLVRLWRHEVFDADDRVAAGLAEAAARDQLVASTLIDDSVADAAGRARARGARVTLRASPAAKRSPAPLAFRRATAAALEACGEGSAAMIQWHPDDDLGPATIVLSSPKEPFDHGAITRALALLPHVLEIDEGEIWLSLSPDRRPTSPEVTTQEPTARGGSTREGTVEVMKATELLG